MLNNPENETEILTLKNWVRTSCARLKKQSHANKGVIFVIVAFLIVMTVIMSLIDNSSDRQLFATALLWANYALLTILVLSRYERFKSLCAKKVFINTTLLSKLRNSHVTLTMLILSSTIFIFKEVHTIAITYNLTISLCLCILLYHTVLYINRSSLNRQALFTLHSQKIHILYACFIALTFVLATTLDNSQYGSRFQLTILCWIMVLHLLFHWGITQWKLIKQLNNERTDAQLMHLKSQVNPHFLFNTLNNLYGLALEKSEQTPILILKLSKMLRYTIYQSQKSQVKLSEEINNLNDFIELQQIRYHKPVNIVFNCDVDQPDVAISPLLLLILIENAYKHGVEKLTDSAFVNISLRVRAQHLYFSIENNFDESVKNELPGIGLINLQQRLSLLYPEAHQLTIRIDKDTYLAELVIKLRSELST